MKPLSIRASLTVWFIGLTTILLLVFSGTLYGILARALHDGLDSKLTTAASGLVVLCDWDEEAWAPEFEIPEQLAQQLRISQPEIQHSVWAWPSGDVLHSLGEIANLPAPEGQWQSEKQLQVAPEMKWSTLPIEGVDHRVCTMLAWTPPVPAEGHDPAKPSFLTMVRVAQSTEQVNAELDQLGWFIALLTLISGLVISLFAVLLSRRVIRPLQALGDAAHDVRAGKSFHLPHRGTGDEVDALSDHLENAFQRLESALQKQTRFTSDAAHELRNPITVIQSAAEVALRKERKPHEYQEIMRDVYATSKRMGQAMEALLLLAKLDAETVRAHFQPVNLGAVAINSAANLVHGKERIAVMPTRPVMVHGDEDLLRVMMDNLLTNAVRYADPGTPILVTFKDEAQVTLSVTDQGSGFPEGSIDQVFERFYRAETLALKSPGAGLGLALVAEIARAHSAVPSARNVEGGACVEVQF